MGARWLEAAAGQEHGEAQAVLANLFLLGFRYCGNPSGGGTNSSLIRRQHTKEGPDFGRAIHWARRAAETGSVHGQAVLAFILSSGPENLRDEEDAMRWYRRAAEAGSPQGALGLGIILARSAAGREELEVAAKWIRQAAEAGLPSALYHLGIMTENGLGTTRDLPRAADFFRRGAENGHRDCQRRWGEILLTGSVMLRNEVMGEAWLLRASIAGDYLASVALDKVRNSNV